MTHCRCPRGTRDCTDPRLCDDCKGRTHCMIREPACGAPNSTPCAAISPQRRREIWRNRAVWAVSGSAVE